VTEQAQAATAGAAGADPIANPMKIMPPWFQRTAAWIAAIGLVLGQAITVLTRIDQIRAWLLDHLGFSWFNGVHTLTLWIIVACGVAAFLGGACLVYFFYIRPRHRKWTLAYVVAVALGIPVSGYIALSAVPPANRQALIQQQATELAQIVRGQYDPKSGGFRFALNQSSDAPQPWTTGQALVGLLAGGSAETPLPAAYLRKSFEYLNNTRGPDGWGYQSQMKPGVTEATGWVTLAEMLSSKANDPTPIWQPGEEPELQRRLVRDLDELTARQHADGGWGPFSRTENPQDERTYSSLVALMALEESAQLTLLPQAKRLDYESAVRRGVGWLYQRLQTGTNGSVGWWANPNLKIQSGDCLGLTAMAIEVIDVADVQFAIAPPPGFEDAARGFVKTARTGDGAVTKRSLQANCQAGDTDIYLPSFPTLQMEPTTFLWFPWSLAASGVSEDDRTFPGAVRSESTALESDLLNRLPDAVKMARENESLYPAAETLYAVNVYLSHHPHRK
jgi:hypothetical protein